MDWVVLQEVYYIPPNNIADSQTVTVDGTDYVIERELTIADDMEDVLKSLYCQFENLNQLKKTMLQDLEEITLI